MTAPTLTCAHLHGPDRSRWCNVCRDAANQANRTAERLERLRRRKAGVEEIVLYRQPPQPAITTTAGEVETIPDGAVLSCDSGVWLLEDGQWRALTDPYERSQALHGAAVANDRRRLESLVADEYERTERMRGA